ncbi:MAG: hypothetical protein MUO23_11875 [Anaerolineales bacterium]|nr:hypothetical protein [Anaerolineales bacterium]
MAVSRILAVCVVSSLIAYCSAGNPTEQPATPSPSEIASAPIALSPEWIPRPTFTSAQTELSHGKTPGLVLTLAAEPTPSPAPYWDFHESAPQPEGGWVTYRNDVWGFSFQYPAIYDTAPCGEIYLESIEGHTTLHFRQGAIWVRVYDNWAGDLATYVSDTLANTPVQLLTAVESFSLDGTLAFRVIRGFPPSAATQYEKLAFAAYGSRLYSFTYRMMNWVYCDASPISEEAVYDHLLATWHFNP